MDCPNGVVGSMASAIATQFVFSKILHSEKTTLNIAWSRGGWTIQMDSKQLQMLFFPRIARNFFSFFFFFSQNQRTFLFSPLSIQKHTGGGRVRVHARQSGERGMEHPTKPCHMRPKQEKTQSRMDAQSRFARENTCTPQSRTHTPKHSQKQPQYT